MWEFKMVLDDATRRPPYHALPPRPFEGVAKIVHRCCPPISHSMFPPPRACLFGRGHTGDSFTLGARGVGFESILGDN